MSFSGSPAMNPTITPVAALPASRPGWDPAWENNVYGQGRHLNRYPHHAVVGFVFRHYGHAPEAAEGRDGLARLGTSSRHPQVWHMNDAVSAALSTRVSSSMGIDGRRDSHPRDDSNPYGARVDR
jgi:hypothetical protein